MTEWSGLLPALAFVLTVGVSVPVALTAHRSHRSGARPFARALWVAALQTTLLYLLGVFVLWSVGAGVSRTVTLLVVGALSGLLLAALPLLVGRWLLRRAGGLDSETALRYATYGWPVAMLAVFGLFVAPGGVGRVAFFHLGGAEACILGFCGISVLTAGAVLLQAVVALVGPGILGGGWYRLLDGSGDRLREFALAVSDGRRWGCPSPIPSKCGTLPLSPAVSAT
ncbi:hypothetical protein NGM10_05600 [Halorussus salilacus]|uniref:hypothetical protein n=1 Tax=Halorussus salilacus TaxID=2953750 RepID=UPI00209F1062|nr:hypothetical protein [Halorussus salilacus]USZ69214.1 hypothetical protein NGM10_05600 [Halorussus salilacus]